MEARPVVRSTDYFARRALVLSRGDAASGAGESEARRPRRQLPPDRRQVRPSRRSVRGVTDEAFRRRNGDPIPFVLLIVYSTWKTIMGSAEEQRERVLTPVQPVEEPVNQQGRGDLFALDRLPRISAEPSGDTSPVASVPPGKRLASAQNPSIPGPAGGTLPRLSLDCIQDQRG